MTERQKRFADEYLIDLNATRAYKAAYPTVKKDAAAWAAASRLLSDVKVCLYIQVQPNIPTGKPVGIFLYLFATSVDLESMQPFLQDPRYSSPLG